MTQVELGDSAARRRLVAAMRERRGYRGRFVALMASIFGILALLLHASTVGGFLPIESVGLDAQVGRDTTVTILQREVDPMRAQFVVGVAAMASVSAAALGVDRLVPQQYETVQAAHDAAGSGDRIVLAPGTYPMQDWTISKSVRIESAAGCLATTVSGAAPGALGRAFSIGGGSAKLPVSVVGITFVGGAENAVTSGNVAFERCRFVSAGDSSTFGGALQLVGASHVRLERCSFEQCTASGAGAVSAISTTLTVTNCVFRNNSATWTGGPSEGGAVHMVGSVGTFDGCIFVGNTAAIGGAICRWWNNPIVLVSDTRFGGNSSDWNCCVQCVGCGLASQSEFTDDCNSNGIADRIEILLQPEVDLNGDEVLDTCQCVADIVDDGAVNAADLAVVLVAWGTSGAQYPGVDIDGNGVVDGADLGAVLAAWGPCPE